MAIRRMVLLGIVLNGCAATPPPQPPPQPREEGAPTSKVFELAKSVGVEEDLPEDAVESRISKVTVYSDRAIVTRRAKVTVQPEATEYRFAQLPGVSTRVG